MSWTSWPFFFNVTFSPVHLMSLCGAWASWRELRGQPTTNTTAWWDVSRCEVGAIQFQIDILRVRMRIQHPTLIDY
ncbi:hypothetical protein GE21DRAFT_1286478 [Neurospora crassa]|nr:hypothetical protein GE21DRAFT_1286478 [Neurospora crassa]